jgi:hypothetical protein
MRNKVIANVSYAAAGGRLHLTRGGTGYMLATSKRVVYSRDDSHNFSNIKDKPTNLESDATCHTFYLIPFLI